MLGEHLEEELRVSRSVVREAVRVLQSLGLVETIKRVGIRVLPASRWNPFDPLVIRWRLAGEGRGAQLRSLAELRAAVEPVAAELAAVNAPAELRRELTETSHAMRNAGQAGDVPRFLELDIHFHSLLLTGSGNEMFANMVGQVAETLTGRTVHGLMPDRPGDAALQWHLDVAEAIAAGDAAVGAGSLRPDHAAHHRRDGADLEGPAPGVRAAAAPLSPGPETPRGRVPRRAGATASLARPGTA